MALLFTIKVASERSWWGTGAQVSHSGELLLRDDSDVETKGAPLTAVRRRWYLTSRLCLESPLTLYPPFPSLPLVSPGSGFLKEGGEASAEPRDEAAGPAGRDGGSAPRRAPRAARPDLGLKNASDFPAPPQIAGYSSPTVPTLRPPS